MTGDVGGAVRVRSPDGRFVVSAPAVEMRMSHWVYPPTLTAASGETLGSLHDSRWSLDAAEWLDATRVRLHLRRYPRSRSVRATVDAADQTVSVDGRPPVALAALESELDAALGVGDGSAG